MNPANPSSGRPQWEAAPEATLVHPSSLPLAWGAGAWAGPACSDPDLCLIVERLLPVLFYLFGEIIQFLLFVANNKNTKTFTSWQPDFLRYLSNKLKRFFSMKGIFCALRFISIDSRSF